MNIESMDVTSGALEKREAIAKDITTVETMAASIIVTSNEVYSQAGEMLITVKKVKKTIEEYFKPLKTAAYTSWKQICTRENEELEKLTPAINHLNKQMTAWNIEQEKIRKAEEERLRQEAFKAEEERRLVEALQAEKEGNKEEAIAIIEEPVFVPPVIVEKKVPKITGQTLTTTWKWRIKNEKLIPREYLMTDDVMINATVRAQGNKTNIPGIEVYPVSAMRGVRT